MRLADLNPEFVYTKPRGWGSRRVGVGVAFDCPCGRREHRDSHGDSDRRVYVPFANHLGGLPGQSDRYNVVWQRTGETFDTLTLEPSIHRSVVYGGCGWHGFIRDGEVVPA
jgi:hypothetical protein